MIRQTAWIYVQRPHTLLKRYWRKAQRVCISPQLTQSVSSASLCLGYRDKEWDAVWLFAFCTFQPHLPILIHNIFYRGNNKPSLHYDDKILYSLCMNFEVWLYHRAVLFLAVYYSSILAAYGQIMHLAQQNFYHSLFYTNMSILRIQTLWKQLLCLCSLSYNITPSVFLSQTAMNMPAARTPIRMTLWICMCCKKPVH